MSKDKLLNEVLLQLKATDEYKRSQAIANCITFLLNKVKELEKKNNDLCNKISEMVEKNTLEGKVNSNLKSEAKVLQSQTELYKTKLSVTEELNQTLEQTIIELKNKINSDKINNDKKIAQLSLSIKDYQNQIQELSKEKDEIKNENEKINNEVNESKKYEEINKDLNIKIKKYEVLLYKMDLENQGYKNEIQKYQNQISTLSGQAINFIPIYKIDLNRELENIENNNNNNDEKESDENYEEENRNSPQDNEEEELNNNIENDYDNNLDNINTEDNIENHIENYQQYSEENIK